MERERGERREKRDKSEREKEGRTPNISISKVVPNKFLASLSLSLTLQSYIVLGLVATVLDEDEVTALRCVREIE